MGSINRDAKGLVTEEESKVPTSPLHCVRTEKPFVAGIEPEGTKRRGGEGGGILKNPDCG